MQDKATIDTYNKYAQTYDQEVIEFWEKFPRAFLEQFAGKAPSTHILDVGSGSGRDALLLKKMGLDVVCVDASQSMVQITTNLGFESYLADFSQLKFPADSFDGIWAYTSLIHVSKEEAGRTIQKLRTFLKPGGVFAIGVIEGDTVDMVERKTMPGALRYFKNYQSAELRELIEPLGFSFVYELKYQPHNSVYLNQLYRIA